MSNKKKRNSHAKLVTNRHHLLFQRKHWSNSEYGSRLRELFIYDMSVKKHDRLHLLLHDIPKPSESELKGIYCIVMSDIHRVRSMIPAEACEYLAGIADFEPFKAVMKYQAELLRH